MVRPVNEPDLLFDPDAIRQRADVGRFLACDRAVAVRRPGMAGLRPVQRGKLASGPVMPPDQ